MIVELTAEYDFLVRYKRKRNYADVKDFVIVPIEIQTLSDTTTVARLRRDRSTVEYDLRWREKADGSPQFLIPVFNHADEALSGQGAEREIARRLSGQSRAGSIDPALEVVEILGEERAKAEAINEVHANAAASTYVLIDGVLHVETCEPVLQLSSYRGNDGEKRGWVDLRFYDSHHQREQVQDNLYGVSKLESLRADYFHGDEPDAFASGIVEVSRPGVFRFDEESRRIISRASSVVHRMVSDLEDADLAFFEGYAQARDAVAAWRRGEDLGPRDILAFYVAADQVDRRVSGILGEGYASEQRRRLDKVVSRTRFAAFVPDAPERDDSPEIPEMRLA